MICMYTSRFSSMLKLAEFLIEDGHQVSVLTPAEFNNKVKSPKIEIINFQVSGIPLPLSTQIQENRHSAKTKDPKVKQMERSRLFL